MWYWYGRFTTLFINFEPIETDQIDLNDGFDEQFLLTSSATGGALALAYDQKERQAKVNDVIVQSPRVRGLFSNAYGFSSGYMNASFGDVSPNAKICQTNLTRIVDQSKEFVVDVKNATEESLSNATDAFENILASVHPISFSCYSSVDEFSDTWAYYLETFEDFSKISYNLVHKMGNLYDTIYYLRKHQQTFSLLKDLSDAEIANWWFKEGIYYGTITFLMFYTPNEIEPYDPLDEYTGLGPDPVPVDDDAETTEQTEGADEVAETVTEPTIEPEFETLG